MSTTPKKRTRRTHEKLIADLEAKIAAIKANVERRQARRDPALRHVATAARAIDKALELSKDKVLRSALGEARLTLTSCLAANGAVTRGASPAKPRGRRGALATEDLAERLLSHVQSHPGQRGEQIAATFGMDSATIRAPMKELIASGKVRTQGQRRGMSYYPVG